MGARHIDHAGEAVLQHLAPMDSPWKARTGRKRKSSVRTEGLFAQADSLVSGAFPGLLHHILKLHAVDPAEKSIDTHLPDPVPDELVSAEEPAQPAQGRLEGLAAVAPTVNGYTPAPKGEKGLEHLKRFLPTTST
jgi:hypothetical protein